MNLAHLFVKKSQFLRLLIEYQGISEKLSHRERERETQDPDWSLFSPSCSTSGLLVEHLLGVVVARHCLTVFLHRVFLQKCQ